MADLKIFAGDFSFDARLEDCLAPKTCAAFAAFAIQEPRYSRSLEW